MLINCPTSASVICRYKCRATKNRKLTGSQSVSWQFFTILLGLFYYSGTNIPEIDGVWGCTFYCPLLFPVSPSDVSRANVNSSSVHHRLHSLLWYLKCHLYKPITKWKPIATMVRVTVTLTICKSFTIQILQVLTRHLQYDTM